MFVLCFVVWTALVDNVVLPDHDRLQQDAGLFTRYRMKEWRKVGNLNLMPNELLIYASMKEQEQVYYLEYKDHFEAILQALPEGTPIQMRYVNGFPKIWKRQLYDLQISGNSILSFSSQSLEEKQKEIWKTTAIIGGVYLLLVGLGLLNKPSAK
jgi:hypothetical protein